MGKLNKKNIIIIILVVIGSVALLVMAYIKNKNSEYDIKKHINETAITVNGHDVSLKETMYYIKDVEDMINSMAVKYNPDEPNQFWNTHYSMGEDSVFIRDYAKEVAIDECIYDYVMELEAQSNGIYLTDYEVQAQEEAAQSYYESLDSQMLKTTGMTKDIAVEAFKRHTLVQKYVSKAVTDIDNRGYSGDDTLSQLSYSGEYYKQNILSKYSVSQNDEIWNNITMGTITGSK